MTERNNQKPRLNIIDYVLIILAIALGISLVFHIKNYKIEPKADLTSEQIVIGIKISPLREELKGNVNTGDTVYIEQTGEIFGEVKNLSDSIYTYEGIDATSGKTVSTSVSGYFVLNLTVAAEGNLSDEGYYANGKLISLGGEISIRTKNFCGTGTIVSIDATNGEG